MKRFNEFAQVKSNNTPCTCACCATSFDADTNMIILDAATIAASIFMLSIINIINILSVLFFIVIIKYLLRQIKLI